MGQKTHPFGFRLGITEAHRSRWYAPKALYGELLVEDQKIRVFLDKRLNRRPPNAAVSDVHIERTREELKVIIKTARPGLVIGPKGAEVDRMTEELQYMTGRKVAISILEIKNPDLDAQLAAEAVAEQLAKRAGFRRVIKMRAEQIMSAGAGVSPDRGAAGRGEMSRTLDVRLGSLRFDAARDRIRVRGGVVLYGKLGADVDLRGCTRPSGPRKSQRGGRAGGPQAEVIAAGDASRV